MDAIALLIFVAVVSVVSLPIWIAYARKHPARGWIGLLCILTFWTGYTWLIAFVWSLMPFQKEPKITITEVDICQGCNPRWPTALPEHEQKLARLELLYHDR